MPKKHVRVGKLKVCLRTENYYVFVLLWKSNLQTLNGIHANLCQVRTLLLHLFGCDQRENRCSPQSPRRLAARMISDRELRLFPKNYSVAHFQVTMNIIAKVPRIRGRLRPRQVPAGCLSQLVLDATCCCCSALKALTILSRGQSSSSSLTRRAILCNSFSISQNHHRDSRWRLVFGR